MNKPRLCRKFGEPLADSVWEINFPEPEQVLLPAKTQNISWAQWMDEIEDCSRQYSKPRPSSPCPERFVL